MTPGDRVTYQHGHLGKLDGQITAIKGEWPKQKIDVALQGRRRAALNGYDDRPGSGQAGASRLSLGTA
jgi:hypothetical protein